MAKIKVLDDLTIQKIAAGEVIERPASIVKELVENSIDANSDSIVIEISNGGKSYIRITDNGDGMEKEDLSIAFKKHSTSKINKIEDLFSVMSLGFRGEALSSITSVAKVEVLTKTKGANSGIQAFVEEGEITSMDIIGSPKGTTMIVRDLFYNLPVRKNFLKSDLSEGNHISSIVTKLALGNSDVSFKFIRDNKTILQTSQNNTLLDNIYNILGKDIAKSLTPIEYEDNKIKFSGYISNTNLYRGNRNHQYLYINGRYVVNYAISKVIENHYKSLIPINKFPVFILYLEIDPLEIDINIHPTKQEIKFLNDDFIYGKISNIIKESLMPSIRVPKFKINNETKEEKVEIPKLFDLDKSSIFDEFVVKDFTKSNFNNIYEEEDVNVNFIFDDLDEEESNEIEETNDNIQNKDIIENKSERIIVEEQKIEDLLLDIKPIGRVFNTYVIAESNSEDKLIFIDQHAAHERILYERYKDEFENEKVNVQIMMFPEIIELTDVEMSYLIENIDIFKDLGFDIDEFGQNSIALRAVPMVFGTPNAKDLFLDILDNIDSGIKSNYDTKVEKIMKIACTNAIKSGDSIGNVEIMALVKDLKACNNPYTCPHGRPTIIEMTKKDIEKQFLRIM
ncbi:MAG: DNA mismatch repair endonuclease MutL [Tissierellaceae bacterium]|nr:DNA mismatch repair endonuclease MutL [Tissierellaceae bacterium]